MCRLPFENQGIRLAILTVVLPLGAIAYACSQDSASAPVPSADAVTAEDPAPNTTVTHPTSSESNEGPEASGVRLLLPVTSNPLAGAARVDKRLFGVIPNHRAEQESDSYKPLTTWQKFKLAEKDTFDWPNFIMMAGFSLQTQVAEKGWRQKGFGRNFAQYYGRAFGDALIGNYITEALMPSLLREDPRFFRSGHGSVGRRTYKAVRQLFITRTVDGGERFNFSEIAGNAAVVGVTSLYYSGNRTLGSSAERVAMAIGNDMISNLMTEFWPDIKQRIQPLLRRHRAHAE